MKMGSENISVIGKKLDIFLNRFDNPIKVGSVRLTERDIKSETDFIEALQKVIKGLDNGTYAIHHNEGLFARFDIKKKQVTKLHKWSENTEILMPCWNYFKE
jgi:ABC-type thiamine transport system substrate-binding protein